MKKLGLFLLFLILGLAVIWVSKTKVELENADKLQAEKVAAEAPLASSQGQGTGASASQLAAVSPAAEGANGSAASAPEGADEGITFDQLNQCLGKRLQGQPACAQTIAADLLNVVAENQNNYRFSSSPEIEAERKKAVYQLVKDCKFGKDEAADLLKLDLSGC